MLLKRLNTFITFLCLFVDLSAAQSFAIQGDTLTVDLQTQSCYVSVTSGTLLITLDSGSWSGSGCPSPTDLNLSTSFVGCNFTHVQFSSSPTSIITFNGGTFPGNVSFSDAGFFKVSGDTEILGAISGTLAQVLVESAHNLTSGIVDNLIAAPSDAIEPPVRIAGTLNVLGPCTITGIGKVSSSSGGIGGSTGILVSGQLEASGNVVLIGISGLNTDYYSTLIGYFGISVSGTVIGVSVELNGTASSGPLQQNYIQDGAGVSLSGNVTSDQDVRIIGLAQAGDRCTTTHGISVTGSINSGLLGDIQLEGTSQGSPSSSGGPRVLECHGVYIYNAALTHSAKLTVTGATESLAEINTADSFAIKMDYATLTAIRMDEQVNFLATGTGSSSGLSLGNVSIMSATYVMLISVETGDTGVALSNVDLDGATEILLTVQGAGNVDSVVPAHCRLTNINVGLVNQTSLSVDCANTVIDGAFFAGPLLTSGGVYMNNSVTVNQTITLNACTHFAVDTGTSLYYPHDLLVNCTAAIVYQTPISIGGSIVGAGNLTLIGKASILQSQLRRVRVRLQSCLLE
jgi:hypothetical protein